jgi:hypothetical protein
LPRNLVVNSDLKGKLVWAKGTIRRRLAYGNTVKLRGHPKDFTTKLQLKNCSGQVNSLGYGKNVKYVTMDNPQPSPKLFVSMGAVHRLDVGGPYEA